MPKLKIAKELFDLFFPVGYIYTSMNSTNPKTLFGYGEWTQITDKFLYCTTTSKATGGSTTTGSWSGTSGSWSGTSGSHAITESQMPSHTHIIGFNASWGDVWGSAVMDGYAGPNTAGGALTYINSSYRKTYVQPEYGYLKNQYTGGGQGHTHSIPSHTHSIPSHTHSQNLPPYMSCYAWYRTA